MPTTLNTPTVHENELNAGNAVFTYDIHLDRFTITWKEGGKLVSGTADSKVLEKLIGMGIVKGSIHVAQAYVVPFIQISRLPSFTKYYD